MVLNNKAQMFSVWFPMDFFYPEVTEKWTKYIQRSKLPYTNLTDFMNAQIQSVTYPSINIESATQQQGQYEIHYTTGKELEPILTKDLTITFKLTESYITYFVIYDQVFWFLEYKKKYPKKKRIFMDDLYLSFLSDAGLSLITFQYKYLVPTNVSQFNLSYASQVSQFTTFDFGLHYNRMVMNLE